MLLCAGISEKGPAKPVNQDAYLVKRAQTSVGDVCLALVADGMGGLQQGEVASAAIVRAFDGWFQRNLPLAGESLGFASDAFSHALRIQWLGLLQEVNLSLMKRGLREGISLGAACTVFLAAAGVYYVMQVGDTRLYCVEDSTCEQGDCVPQAQQPRMVQLTRDQTFVEQELAAGRLSEEEAARHPLRGALLQCVGASHDLKPIFEQGIFDSSAAYVLVSDGFYRSFTDEEMAHALNGQALCAAAISSEYPAPLQSHLKSVVDVSFARGGRDDATVVVVTAFRTSGASSHSRGNDAFCAASLCDEKVQPC